MLKPTRLVGRLPSRTDSRPGTGEQGRISQLTGSWKKGLLGAAGALIIGAAAIGTAIAQQTPTPATIQPAGPQREGPRRLLELVASKVGVTPERLQQAIVEARQELGMPGMPGGPGRGHHRGMPDRFRGVMQQGMDIVANELHISVDQLRTELPGSSLAAVSRNHGVDPQQVAMALTNAANQRIDTAQGAGRITADQASRIRRVRQMADANGPIDRHDGERTPWCS